MDKKSVDQIFFEFSKTNPEPKTELEYSNNYTLLVAVVLSAQATDISVNKATKKLFSFIDTPEKMVDLGVNELRNHIKSIGLFNTKAINVINLSKDLISKFDSQVPENYEALISLPGVGKKTADVVLNCAFGHPTIAVDTHVFRVAKRIGLTSASNINGVADDLQKVIPKNWRQNAHHWLILHGRYICKARKPACELCPITKYCLYYKNNCL